MANKLDDNRPIYLQIKEVIEDSIINGTIKVGDRVPSTNELAKFYKINPATARQGMNELVSEDILRKQRGVGMFVTENAKEILDRKSTRLNSSHVAISYAVFCLKKKKSKKHMNTTQNS